MNNLKFEVFTRLDIYYKLQFILLIIIIYKDILFKQYIL